MMALSENSNFREFIFIFIDLVRMAIPLVASLALLAFFWGLAQFIFKAGDAKANEEGKNLMVYGVVALFVMVSVWGILRFFYTDLGLPGNLGIPTLPER